MFFEYIQFFLLTFLLSIILSFLVKKISLQFNIVDLPDSERKIHKQKIPLLGGLAIFVTFFIILFFLKDKLLAGDLETSHWVGVFIGGCFLMIGGFLDDKFSLKPSRQIIWPILAITSLLLGGVGIEKITNPLGGSIMLKSAVFSSALIFIWLLGMMYTTKILDGLDGLVSGVSGIGGIIIFLFTITTKYYQPDIGLAALIFAAACFGFLVFNWHPAKIFLGEGGSLFLGYVLGVLAIISGGKIAITLLVMGIPIMDVAWTIIRRLLAKKNPFKFADKNHLHFLLLSLGIGQRKTVLIFYLLALSFGLSGLFLQSMGKLLALGLLFLTMLFLVISLNLYAKKEKYK